MRPIQLGSSSESEERGPSISDTVVDTMRSIQRGSSSESDAGGPSISDTVMELTETWQEARETAIEGRSTDSRRPESDRARLDLAIAGLSLLLALVAWQRDQSKSRRELVDAVLFGTIGILERYVTVRNR